MNTIARFFAAAVFCTANVAIAQDYPTKPIRVIVPLTPGSGADIAGRIVAKYLGDALKQPVLVENRPGAGGIIGTQAMLNADADGYTLPMQSASHAANPATDKSLPCDPPNDIGDHAGRAGLGELQPVAVVRVVGAGRNTARHRPEAERPGERDPAREGSARAVRQDRHHVRADEARRVRQVRARADDRFPEYRKAGEHPAAVS